jgi:SAM-dependent methyltransferase
MFSMTCMDSVQKRPVNGTPTASTKNGHLPPGVPLGEVADATGIRFAVVKTPVLRLLERARLLRPAFRAYERALALGARLRTRGRQAEVGDDGLPLPPPALVVRVAGTSDTTWFLEGGRLGAEAIRAALERNGTSIDDVDTLLDFGCGCGRVTRRWAGLDAVAVHGTDADGRAVEWCRHNLPFATFARNELAPPLGFADATFGLAYGLSVLTHLPEPLQRPWLVELHRVLRPGAWLIVSVHGAHYLPRLDDAERSRFAAGDLVVRWEDAAGSNLCAAYHPRPYLERQADAAGFVLAEFVEEGAEGNPFQDLYVLRKR